MATQPESNRWWENYLVRYLMPSIAGVVIVTWLCYQGGESFRSLLWLPPTLKQLDATSLTLLFLYGNLFCYVASYPILVFHVTRVMDFSNGRWPATPFDGYLATLILTYALFLFVNRGSADSHYWGAFTLAAVFALVQLARLATVFFPRITLRRLQRATNRREALSGPVSRAYAYAYALARRRGIVYEDVKIEGPTPGSTRTTDDDYDEDELEITTNRRVEWRREVIETYRHTREHGNSAFIFLLETALASLAYFVIKPKQGPHQQLASIGALFAVWATPAVFVHLIGQHMERRFSKFDDRLGDGRQGHSGAGTNRTQDDK